MKQIEELICLEMLLDFGKVKVMIDFLNVAPGSMHSSKLQQ